MRAPAFLAYYGDTTAIRLPAAASVGRTVALTFTAFLGGCLRRGPTELALDGSSAHLRPSRIELADLPPNSACPGYLAIDEQTVLLRFSAAGTARVRLEGWAMPEDRPFVIERAIEIRP